MPSQSQPLSTTHRKKRTLTVEQALSWCYRDEVPKIREETAHRGPTLPATHPMWRAGVFGARIDNWANHEPGFPAAMGEPHPDALLIKAAVDGLDVDALDLWGFLISYGMGEDFDIAGIHDKARQDVQAVVVRTATSRRRPDTSDRPEVEAVRSITGQLTVWVREPRQYLDALDRPITVEHDVPTKPVRGGVYPTGAFCKIRYTPSAASVALDRARYAAWWAALAQITETLRTVGLASIDIEEWIAPPAPWIEAGVEEPAAPSVVPSLLPPRQEVLKDRRVAGRRQRPRRNSEVRSIPASEYIGSDKRA